MKAISFSFNSNTRETRIVLLTPRFLSIFFGDKRQEFIGREADDHTWLWTNADTGKEVTSPVTLANLDYARKRYWEECFQ